MDILNQSLEVRLCVCITACTCTILLFILENKIVDISIVALRVTDDLHVLQG